MPRLACQECRLRKVRCKPSRPGVPCERCNLRRLLCSLGPGSPTEVRAWPLSSSDAAAKDGQPGSGTLPTELSAPDRGITLATAYSGLDVGYGSPAELLREGELTQTLLVLYFQNFGDVHIMFDEFTVLRQYALGMVPKVILFSMMALGIRYSHAPFKDPEMRPHWGEPLRREARKLLQEEFDEASVTTTQAYVLQATYQITYGGTGKAWTYLNYARSCLGLLHLKNGPDSDESDPVQAESARRLVATVALMENLLLPFLPIDDTFQRIGLPSRLLSDEDFQALKTRTYQGSNDASVPNLRQEILTLSGIYYTACRLARRGYGHAARSLVSDLGRWHAALADSLRWTDDNFQAHLAKFALRPFTFMHLLYHQASQLLLLDTLQWTTPVLSGDSYHGNTPVRPLEVYNHATWIVDMVVQTWDVGRLDLHNNCFGQVLVITQIVLAHRLLSCRDDAELVAVQRQILTLRNCMIRVRAHCRLFNWIFDEADWFLRICGQDRFWEDERWEKILHEELTTLGTRFERVNPQTAGRMGDLESLANPASRLEHLENSLPAVLRETFRR